MGRTLRSQGECLFENRHSLEHHLIRTRCVVGRRLCSQGEYFSNQRSLGHPLMEDTVMRDVRCVPKGGVKIDTPWGISSFAHAVLRDGGCVLKGSIFQINVPWGIPSWRILCCGTYVVLSRGVLLLNGHSLGHRLMADAVLWDVRCVSRNSFAADRLGPMRR